MRPPIFILAGDGALMMFASPERATSYVESADVEAGEYPHAFDADGCRLTLKVSEPTREKGFLGVRTVELTKVLLEPCATTHADRQAFASQLRRALDVDESNLELPALVGLAERQLPSR